MSPRLRWPAAIFAVGTMVWMLVGSAVVKATVAATASDTGAPDARVPAADSSAPSPAALGITFVEGSTSTVYVEREGKRYLLDLVSRQVKEAAAPGGQSATAAQSAPTSSPTSQGVVSSPQPKEAKPEVYEAGDDFVFSLPSGRRLDRHGFYVNFNHRFAYNPAFTGKARGHMLMGLDDFSISSFGFRYGVTEKFSVGIYRSPSVIGRPIQLSAGYNFLDEHDGNPLNAAFRFSVEGQNDFSRNFTADFEGIFSRSITSRAQIYVVPTVSLGNRRLLSATGALEDPPPKLPGFNTFALGVGGALDIRPTVALVAEVIPTLVNGRELGIHRPAYSFGIQKKIWRHAFTFGFTNSPGTTVSQRAGTRASFLGSPSADTPRGLFIGFDLTRQIF